MLFQSCRFTVKVRRNESGDVESASSPAQYSR
jgi:hypothetical protein